jgi:hypothetical protein
MSYPGNHTNQSLIQPISFSYQIQPERFLWSVKRHKTVGHQLVVQYAGRSKQNADTIPRSLHRPAEMYDLEPTILIPPSALLLSLLYLTRYVLPPRT